MPAGAVSTAGLAFRNSGTPTWRDLPPASRAFGADPAALTEGVREYTTFATNINGDPHQMRVAWRAYVDRIVVVRVVRPVFQGPDGTFRPVGGWRHHEAHTFTAASAPQRTHGPVATEVLIPTTSEGGDAVGAGNREHEKATKVLSFLPARVQRTVTQAVPEPNIWAGVLIRGSVDDIPNEQILRMVRIGEMSAVVLAARRRLAEPHASVAVATSALDRAPWMVTQYVYELASQRPQVEGSRRRWIGSR